MAKRGYAETVRDPPKLRRWAVRANDVVEEVNAHFCFDNGEDGLTFRRYHDDNPDNKTSVVAAYAKGYWQTYKEIDENG